MIPKSRRDDSRRPATHIFHQHIGWLIIALSCNRGVAPGGALPVGLVHGPGANAPGYTLPPLAGLGTGQSSLPRAKEKWESLVLKIGKLFFPRP